MSDEPVIVIVEDDPNIADLVELYRPWKGGCATS